MLAPKIGGSGTIAWASVRSMLISVYGLRVGRLGPFGSGIE
jgi:hypothetical protein